MKRLFVMLCGMLAFAATGAYAVDIDSSFDELDRDGTGYLTVDDISDEPMLSQYWYRFDENNDGVLDAAEFAAFEDAHIDELEPYVLRHEWYGSVGQTELGSGRY